MKRLFLMAHLIATLKTMKLNNKRNIIIIAAVAIALIGAGAFFLYLNNARRQSRDEGGWEAMYKAGTLPEHIVAIVNGEPVVLDEMQMIMAKFRVETIVYFNSAFGLDFARGFWDTEAGGTTPNAHIRKLSLEYISNVKIQQQFMREQGIINDFTYEAFMRDFSRENADREEKADQGETVFGVQRFDAVNYYEYRFLNQIQSLLDTKGDALFPVTGDEILEYYERNIHSFRVDDEIVIDVVVATDDGEDDPYEIILEAESALKDGAGFENVMETYNPYGEPIQINLSDRSAYFVDGELLETAYTLDEGEISGVFEWDGNWFIIRCARRADAQYLGVEGREQTIAAECMWEKYEAFTEQLRERAAILVNEPVFNSLAMEM